MKRTTYILLLTLLLGVPSTCVAQTKNSSFVSNPFFIGLNFHPIGYIVPHSSELKAVELRNPLGI